MAPDSEGTHILFSAFSASKVFLMFEQGAPPFPSAWGPTDHAAGPDKKSHISSPPDHL